MRLNEVRPRRPELAPAKDVEPDSSSATMMRLNEVRPRRPEQASIRPVR